MSDDSKASEMSDTKLKKMVIRIYESIKKAITLDKDRKDAEM